ncbi:MAG TPA: DUF1294 domain-containing protein [Gemmataceae bacterium]|nr:DUF1294 domain-containing protein [Gemmataceae bacterium]
MGKGFARPMRPERFHAIVALTLALAGLGVWLWLFRHSFHWYQLVAGWLAAINLTTFGYYGYDKACARRAARRVPEIVLHGLTLAGGSPAAFLAMRLFRHKTIKGRFQVLFWCIVVLQALLAGWIGWLLGQHQG